MAYTVTTASTTTNAPWAYWAQTSSTTTTGSSTWNYWNQASSSGTTTLCYPVTWQTWNNVYEETAEQRQARELRQAERQEQRDREAAEYAVRAAERREQLARASARAEELLLSLLTDRQAADYREHGWFEVRGSKGGRWRIRNRGQSGNVDLMPEIGNEREASYCAHPPDSLPAADAHLAQMLALVTDEDQFLKVAHRNYTRQAAPQAA